MKINDAESIRNSELELIDSIVGQLDWDAIEHILMERHRFRLQDDVAYKKGDIVVHDSRIAYRLEFDVKLSLSVVFDRDGECLKLSTSGDLDAEEAPPAEPKTPMTAESGVSEMASKIADMISEINE